MEEHFRIEGGVVVYYDGPEPETAAQAWDITMAKWRVLKKLAAEGNDIADGARDTCGLCLFYYTAELMCGQCPITLAGHPGCRDTPYSDYCHHSNSAQAEADATAEIEFLERIRRGATDGIQI